MKEMIFLKHSGPIYEAFRNETTNDYAKGQNFFPDTVGEQLTQLEYWTPPYQLTPEVTKKVTMKLEVPGHQHYTGKVKPK